MRLPQVSERIKEAPAQALRSVFAGIGQLLLVTDKLRNKTPERQEVPAAAPQAREPEPAVVTQAEPPVPAEPSAAAETSVAAERSVAAEPSVAAQEEARRDVDASGNVRLLPGETPEAPPAAAEVPATAEAPATVEVPATAEAPAAKAPAAAIEVPATAEAGVTKAPAATAEAPAAAEAPATAGTSAATGAAALPLPLPNYDDLTLASLRARLRNLSVDQVRALAEYERAHAARPEVIAMFERRVAKLEAGT